MKKKKQLFLFGTLIAVVSPLLLSNSPAPYYGPTSLGEDAISFASSITKTQVDDSSCYFSVVATNNLEAFVCVQDYYMNIHIIFPDSLDVVMLELDTRSCGSSYLAPKAKAIFLSETLHEGDFGYTYSPDKLTIGTPDDYVGYGQDSLVSGVSYTFTSLDNVVTTITENGVSSTTTKYTASINVNNGSEYGLANAFFVFSSEYGDLTNEASVWMAKGDKSKETGSLTLSGGFNSTVAFKEAYFIKRNSYYDNNTNGWYSFWRTLSYTIAYAGKIIGYVFLGIIALQLLSLAIVWPIAHHNNKKKKP